jgi:glyoxylase-like metal-dependent hydrolase (beta-lactamase superfamily II)
MTELPPGVTVFERGWLSSNSILLQGQEQSTLVDSGYCSHAAQTLCLVEQVLGEYPLDQLINTHLHSDHCGGNAAMQQRFPALHTLIPPGHAQEVRDWDEAALTYRATGQECPRFGFNEVLTPGQELRLGDSLWQVHSAPGHDPHAVVLFEPDERVLISGDALWEKGFGVVFPELDGSSAFDEVSATLDVIESLQPRLVIPGHGPVFAQVAQSLTWARQRLEGFAGQPKKHAYYAAKVLLKFKLLELQEVSLAALHTWALAAPYFSMVHGRFFADTPEAPWLDELVQDLVRSGAATRRDQVLYNA